MSAWCPGASAETVWPLSLVFIHPPLRLQHTPGVTSVVIFKGRCPSPSSFHTRPLVPSASPRAFASSGCISSGGVTSPDFSPPNVDVMRSSEAGVIRIRGDEKNERGGGGVGGESE